MNSVQMVDEKFRLWFGFAPLLSKSSTMSGFRYCWSEFALSLRTLRREMWSSGILECDFMFGDVEIFCATYSRRLLLTRWPRKDPSNPISSAQRDDGLVAIVSSSPTTSILYRSFLVQVRVHSRSLSQKDRWRASDDQELDRV